MEHRLKIMRKSLKKTQSEVASYMGIGQNTYSYWEKNIVKIDNNSFFKLADYFGVSIDFLSGKPYTLRNPQENWSEEQLWEYESANEYRKIYLEYLWGDISFGTGTGVPSEATQVIIEDDAIVFHRSSAREVYKLSEENTKIVRALVLSLLGKDA